MSKRKKRPVDLPSMEQIIRERERLRYRRRYSRTLKSTVAVLVVVAAAAVLVATLWMPVLRIYGNKLLIKRVIAGPADWVDLDESGSVFVNGDLLDEPYLTAKAFGETNIELPYQVPDGRYFVMGDNRATSVDSRTTALGCVADDQIVGRVVFRIWPFSSFGAVR